MIPEKGKIYTKRWRQKEQEGKNNDKQRIPEKEEGSMEQKGTRAGCFRVRINVKNKFKKTRGNP